MSPSDLDVRIVNQTRRVLGALALTMRTMLMAGDYPDECEILSAPFDRDVAAGVAEDVLLMAEGKPPPRLLRLLGRKDLPLPAVASLPEGWKVRAVVRDLGEGAATLQIALEHTR